jgi:hypothetical protein
MLTDVDETVRRLAVVGLTKMLSYDGALSALFSALKDSNGHVRREPPYYARHHLPQVVERTFC